MYVQSMFPGMAITSWRTEGSVFKSFWDDIKVGNMEIIGNRIYDREQQKDVCECKWDDRHLLPQVMDSFKATEVLFV